MRGATSHRWSGAQPPRLDATLTTATRPAKWNWTATQRLDNPIWERLDAAPAVAACIPSSPYATTRLQVRTKSRSRPSLFTSLISLLQATSLASTPRSRPPKATLWSRFKGPSSGSRMVCAQDGGSKANDRHSVELDWLQQHAWGSGPFKRRICLQFAVCVVSSAVRMSRAMHHYLL